ncbi:MAG: hypothetical protein R3C18_08990 [Planctomycetaceae bacterium]
MFPTSISLSSSSHLGPVVLLSIGSAVLLCSGILTRRDVPLLLLAGTCGLLAFAADDLIHLLMLSSAATWLVSGVLWRRPKSSEAEPVEGHPTRWIIGLFLADLAAISALSVLGSISTATELPTLIPVLPQLEEMEPALLGMVGLLFLLSLTLRLVLYPAWGWMDVSFTTRKSQLLLTGFLLPLQLLAWQRLLPLIHISDEVRVLGAGVCTLSAVLFGIQSLCHPVQSRALTFLGVGLSSLCLLSSLVSPPPVLWGTTPCYVTALIGLTLLRYRENGSESRMNWWTFPTFILLAGFVLWRNRQLFLAALLSNSIEDMTSSSPISLVAWAVAQALLWGALFRHVGLGEKRNEPEAEQGHSRIVMWSTAAVVLIGSGATAIFGSVYAGLACGLALAAVVAHRRFEPQGEEVANSESQPMRVRLSASNFYLKPLSESVIAWPFACFAFVVHILAEWLFVKLPASLATTSERLTTELLGELETEEGKSLGWEVVVGSMVVLTLAIYVAG